MLLLGRTIAIQMIPTPYVLPVRWLLLVCSGDGDGNSGGGMNYGDGKGAEECGGAVYDGVATFRVGLNPSSAALVKFRLLFPHIIVGLFSDGVVPREDPSWEHFGG